MKGGGQKGERKMGYINNRKYLLQKRRDLRNNPTDAEKYLWRELKNRQLCGRKFRRQHSVGNYIIDFYCPEEKLAIEVDGEQHSYGEQLKYDEERTRYLQTFGIVVLRIKNTDVLFSRDEVVKRIEKYIKMESTP
jgi:very-short-patch-repair endonuclease